MRADLDIINSLKFGLPKLKILQEMARVFTHLKFKTDDKIYK